MYVVKWKDEVVAIQEGKVIKSLDNLKAPYALFINRDMVSMTEFLSWVEDRMFPQHRLDKEKLLKELGLKEYNYLDILHKTKGILTGSDYYSIEWVE